MGTFLPKVLIELLPLSHLQQTISLLDKHRLVARQLVDPSAFKFDVLSQKENGLDQRQKLNCRA